MRALSRPYRVVVPVAALVASALPGVAAAQNLCGPGQVVVDSLGHCCSPGQGWNTLAGQCSSDAAATAPAASAITPSTPPAPTTATAPPAPPVVLFPGVPATSSSFTNLVVQHAPFGDPTAPVPVTFAPEQPGDIENLVLQPVVGAAIQCSVPCIVNLPPGYVTITGTGQRSFETAFNVPPFAPVTVQINHLDSAAPGFVAGGLMTALGLFGGIGGGYLVSTGDDSKLGIGITGIILGSLVLLFGIGVLGNAASSGTHPVTLMNPGDLSQRPITGANDGVHFAGIDATLPERGGGALLRGGITF